MFNKYCEKLRYFQDEIKNYIEAGNDEETCVGICHKIKLYNLDVINKGTVTDNEDENQTEPEIEVPQEQFETYSFSGKFRDETRRIDLVVVLPDDAKPEAESMRINFLISIIKAGFEIELERGILPEHKQLVFVKIHAPDAIMEEYVEKVGVKKYFKHCHLDYIPAKKMFCFKNSEKQWLQLVRRNYEAPLYYSNIERSLVVYKVLLQLRFGENQNNFGLQRLLHHNIVTDVFGLHDGPYFLTNNQDFTKVTGRQILYYNWVGLRHIFKSQPLNMIQEYLGSRIGFYFTFMQFYIMCLILPALAGILDVVYGYMDDTYQMTSTGACKDERYACPRCLSFEICPFLIVKDNYCLVAKLVNLLDHKYIYFYSYFIILWAPIFIIFWRRNEKYWIWMWELIHIKNIITTRPEFSINYNNPARSTSTGLWKYYNSGRMKVIRLLATFAFIGVSIYLAFWFYFRLLYFKYDTLLYIMKSKDLPKSYEKFIVVGVFTLICIASMTIFEKLVYIQLFIYLGNLQSYYMYSYAGIMPTNVNGLTSFEERYRCWTTLYFLSDAVFQIFAIIVTRFENHRTNEAYEKSLTIKLFIISFFSTFPILIYYSWYKVRLFFVPGRPYNAGLSRVRSSYYNGYTRNCGPLPCIDEVGVSLTIIFIIKQLIPKLLLFIKYIFYNSRTDYNQGRSINQIIPCWEREYRLNTITENDMIKKYNYLAMQLALVTWFVPSSPLLPLLALIINLIDVRITSRQFLLGSRRPLLHERMGVDIWSSIFTIISLISITTNAVLLAWSTRVAKRYYYLTLPKKWKDFYEYYVSHFTPSDFSRMADTSYLYRHYKGIKPSLCIFPGNMPTLEAFQKDYPSFPNMYYYYPRQVPFVEYWVTKMYENVLLLVIQYSALFFVILVYFLFPPSFQDVEDSMQMERNIKDAFITHTGS